MEKLYLVGTIINTFGIKGEVKVKSETTFDRFKKGSSLILVYEGKNIPIKIDSHRIHQGMDLITFNGLTNINDVEKYKGSSLYVTHEEKMEGVIYYEDLIGKDVVVDGKVIGKCFDIRELPKGILLEVKVKDEVKLIPYVKDFIKEVNSDSIIVTPIEGLL